ncbi:MAG: serine/threonine-protein kinase [Thermoanaerobaculia bacterium]|nr:serine/threonine-protein kinase [Thermoanaerobaculia bacterium]
MTIAPGVRLGPYEVLSPLGAGGMGEVYRARDTRLARDVAVKILPEAFLEGEDRKARFEREARLLAAMNDPNIAAIYSFEEIPGSSGSSGRHLLVMELIEGETLRAFLRPGPLPVKKLLQLAAQVAAGLGRAHAAGIVHRDLKPENLMVTTDGFVKILDFGLAKLVPTDAGNLTAAQTASRHTQPGIVVGTVAYMSPEQAGGEPVDFRSDQFSFGSILYEMATGRHPFRKPTGVETLTAILREEPEPVGSLNAQLPMPLRWIIERCLAKDPQERYASTQDLARDMTMLRDRLPEAGLAPAGEGVSRRGPRALPWVLLALALGALVAVLVFSRQPRAAREERLVRFSVGLPPGASFSSSEVSTDSAISPDGSRLVLVGWSRGLPRLYLRGLDSLAAEPMEGTEDADSPFWSPDSRFIGFFAEGKLKKVPAAGGPPQTICDAPHEGPGTWGGDGTILFSEAGRGAPAISRVPSGGGTPQRVTRPDPSRPEELHIYPHFLPDGRRFLFVAVVPMPEEMLHELRAGDLGSAETTLVSRIGSRVAYAPPGVLLSVRDGSLLAQPFDAKTLKLSDESTTVVDRLHYFYGPANAGFSVSQSGALAYEAGRRPSRVAWLDRAGLETSTLVEEGDLENVRLSPDGRRLAVSVFDRKTGSADVWVHELERKVATRLTLLPFTEDAPVWSPDGRRVAFRSDRHGPPDLYEMDAGSPGSEKELLRHEGVQQTEDWSPDGRFVAYTESSRRTGEDIWLLPLFGDRKPVPYLRTRFGERSPRFSPDGRWIAYGSDETGTIEVYVSPRDDSGKRTRLSTGGGQMPRWRRDGKELYYLAPDRSLMAVPVRLGAVVDAGAPARLFRFASGVLDYDVSPAGDRFIAATPVAGSTDGPVRVILGWPTLLKRRGL